MTALSGCEQAPVEEEASRVVVTPVFREDVSIYGSYVGQTQACKRVEVNPRVDGFLEETSFIEGSVVRSRDTL